MANRRMFSKSVVESARFLKMSISARALYFHLGMDADDDGIVEAFTVMRMAGTTDADLHELVTQGFATLLDENDLVAYLNDWQENNKLRADRKTDSRYQELLLKVLPDVNLVEARPSYYSRKNTVCQTNDRQQTDNSQTNDRLGKDSIGKDSIGKDSIGKDSVKEKKHFVPPTIEEVKQYCIDGSYNVDAQRFIDFYESKGWMVGKNKMKDWKAALRNWSRRNTEERRRESVENNGKKYNDRSKYGDL